MSTTSAGRTTLFVLGALLTASVSCSSGGRSDTSSPQAVNKPAEQVTAPVAVQANQTALAVMTQEAQAQIASAPVLVLAPSDPAILTQATVTTGNGYYSLSAQLDGVSVVVQGSPIPPGAVTVATAPVSSNRIGNRQVFTTLNEGIRSATWIDAGVAYSMDIECAKPSDERCSSEAYVFTLVNSLTALGGRRQ